MHDRSGEEAIIKWLCGWTFALQLKYLSSFYKLKKRICQRAREREKKTERKKNEVCAEVVRCLVLAELHKSRPLQSTGYLIRDTRHTPHTPTQCWRPWFLKNRRCQPCPYRICLWWKSKGAIADSNVTLLLCEERNRWRLKIHNKAFTSNPAKHSLSRMEKTWKWGHPKVLFQREEIMRANCDEYNMGCSFFFFQFSPRLLSHFGPWKNG